MNTETICAALLHDTVEDTDYTLAELRSEFGEDVAALVDGVTKLDKVKYGDSAEAETVRKMVVAMSRDIRVLVIKLADRLHNMRTLRYMPRDKQERKSRETLEIYAPLAHRLGMNTVKWELEDLAFATLYPKRYDEIARLVSQRSPRRDQLLQEVIENLSADMHEAQDQGHGHRPPQALLLDLPEDDRPQRRVRRHLRPGRHPRPGRHASATATRPSARSTRAGIRYPAGSRTTSRCRSSTCTSRCTPRSSAPAASRSSCRSAPGACTSGRSTASPRTGSTRKTCTRTARPWPAATRDKAGSKAEIKASQDAAEMAWLRQLVDWQRETEDPAEFLDSLRFDLAERRGLRLHPARRGHRAAARRHPGRLRLRDPHRRRPPHDRRPGQRPPGRARVDPRQRRHGGDLHLQVAGGGPEPGLAELRQERPRPQQDPPVVLQGAPRGRGRGGQGPDRQGDAQAGPPAAAAHVGRHAPHDRRRPPLPRPVRPVRRGRRGPDQRPVGRRASWSARSAARPAPRRTWPRSPRSRPRPPRSPGPAPPATRASRSRASADVWVRLSKCCTPVPGDEIQGFVTHGHGVSVHRANCVNLEHLSDTQRERMVPVHWAPSDASRLPGRDPGRGPRPHPAAVRRHPRPVRPARQHPAAPASRPPGTGSPSAASPSRWATPSTSATSCAPSATSTASTTSTASPTKDQPQPSSRTKACSARHRP